MSNSSLEFVQKDHGFKVWTQKNIIKLDDLYDGETLMSFQQLKDSYQIPATHFYRYLQLRHFIQSQLGGSLKRPRLSQLESLLTQKINGKHISLTYDLLMANNKANTNLVKEKWEQDLGITIDDDHWSLLLTDAQKGFINARYKICNFKIIHRFYYTPEKISRFKGNTSPHCTRCKTEIGNFLHMTWTCPKLEQWWEAIEHTLKKVLNMELSLSPLIVLLGDYSNLQFNSVNSADFFGLAMTAAKKCVLSKWIAEDPSNYSHWVNELNYCMPLEKITYNVRGNPQRFLKTWQAWIDFLET